MTYKKKLLFYSLILVVTVETLLIGNYAFDHLFRIDDFVIDNDNDDKHVLRLSQADPIRLDEFLNPSGRRYVFLDLGANTGDSVYNFFNFDNSLPKILTPYLVSKAAWTVHAYEANPKFDRLLAKMKRDIETNDDPAATHDKHHHKVHVFNRTAVWTYDGYIDFYLDEVNEARHFYGSSLKRAHPDVRDGKSKLNVTCVDLARVLREFERDDFVVIKMDVEGAEYDLLTHMIVNDVLPIVDLMAIEYHKRLSFFRTPEQVFNYILKSSGVRLSKWV